MQKVLIDIIGYVGASLTTIAFLPQVIKTIRLKKADEISLMMYIMFCVGLLCWLIYGMFIMNLPLIGANGIAFILAMIVLYFKIKFG